MAWSAQARAAAAAARKRKGGVKKRLTPKATGFTAERQAMHRDVRMTQGGSKEAAARSALSGQNVDGTRRFGGKSTRIGAVPAPASAKAKKNAASHISKPLSDRDLTYANPFYGVSRNAGPRVAKHKKGGGK